MILCYVAKFIFGQFLRQGAAKNDRREVNELSKKAIENLQKIWRGLVFVRVAKVVAREADIIDIKTYEPGDLKCKTYSRIDEVPDDAWKDAVISYAKFYGFAQGILFHSNDSTELDMFNALDFSTYLSQQRTCRAPKEGDLIAGTVVKGPRGRKFSRWFVCGPQLKLLIDMVLAGKTDISEKELSEKLMCDPYPDLYWAIARLVMFDNVQAFVDELKDIKPIHPSKGKIYKQGWHNFTVDWHGMYIPKEAAQFVHELSFHLNEPVWWEQFMRLASEQGLKHSHPVSGGFCVACARI